MVSCTPVYSLEQPSEQAAEAFLLLLCSAVVGDRLDCELSQAVMLANACMTAETEGGRLVVLIVDDFPLFNDYDVINFVDTTVSNLFGPANRMLIFTTLIPRLSVFGDIGKAATLYSVIPPVPDISALSSLGTPYTGTIVTNFIAVGRSPALLKSFCNETYVEEFVEDFDKFVQYYGKGLSLLFEMPAIHEFAVYFLGVSSETGVTSAAYSIFSTTENGQKCLNSVYTGIILKWYEKYGTVDGGLAGVLGAAIDLCINVMTRAVKHNSGTELEAMTECRILIGFIAARNSGVVSLHPLQVPVIPVNSFTYFMLDPSINGLEEAKQAIENRLERYGQRTAMLVSATHASFHMFDHFLVIKEGRIKKNPKGYIVVGFQEKTTKQTVKYTPPDWVDYSLWIQGNSNQTATSQSGRWSVPSSNEVAEFFGPSLSLMQAAHWN
jgi:hypothetical protein